MDTAELDEICLEAKSWLPPISEDDKQRVMRILTGSGISYGTVFLRKYLEFLRPYADVLDLDNPREADCVASGIVFFYGCLAYIMHFPGWGQHIEAVFLYDLLYMLVDHYIDDIDVHDELKSQAIFQMYILIENPHQHETLAVVDPVLKVIAETYARLLELCPNTKESIIRLFNVEIAGLKVQCDPHRSREDYYRTALDKGGCTMQVLQHIVNDPDPELVEISYHLGTIMQLIDDCVDLRADLDKGIHTVATHDYLQTGRLDELWADIMRRIFTIHPRFTLFIMVYNVFAIYVPDRESQAFSQELKSRSNPLNLFDYNYGCDGSTLLVNAIMSELVAWNTLYS